MSDDTVKKLGTIRTQDEGRDAIHIAVVTLQATENIRLGGALQYVTAEGERVGANDPKAVGIIDPFLPPSTTIKVGQWFYVYLKPASITGLQHVWSHPAFPVSEPPALAARVADRNTNAVERVESFCNDVGILYDDFIQVLVEGSAGRLEHHFDYVVSRGRDLHGDIPASILDDVERIIGRRLANRPTHFSCSC